MLTITTILSKLILKALLLPYLQTPFQGEREAWDGERSGETGKGREMKRVTKEKGGDEEGEEGERGMEMEA